MKLRASTIIFYYYLDFVLERLKNNIHTCVHTKYIDPAKNTEHFCEIFIFDGQGKTSKNIL